MIETSGGNVPAKRVLICNTEVPFAYGGSEVLTETLDQQLRQAGFDSALVQLPYQWHTPEIHLRACHLWESVDLSTVGVEPVDAVICTKFPTYLSNHPNKIVWLFHQFRACTDLYGTPFGLPDTAANQAYRMKILEKDRVGLTSSRKLFAISQNVAGRLKRYVGLESEVLYPPVQGEDLLHADTYGPYVLQVCRMEQNKRPQLVIEALRHTKKPVRAVIVGTGSMEQELRNLVHRYKLTDRVEIKGRVPLGELVALYSMALGVVITPVDEDYGLVTVEAFKAKRPVIATNDSGGVLEFVHPGLTGLVVSPDPREIGEAIDQLFENRVLCAKLGAEGCDGVREITWKGVLERLLSYL